LVLTNTGREVSRHPVPVRLADPLASPDELVALGAVVDDPAAVRGAVRGLPSVGHLRRRSAGSSWKRNKALKIQDSLG
jgi:hypothetical protein